jgi:dTDP-4-amino-4,6-dideoxygalactose transaminase
VPDDREQAYHMFYVLLADNDERNRVLGEMRSRGVFATFHYVPLHSAPGGRRVAAHPTECPVTDDISGRLLRLPFYTDLTDEDAQRVVETFLAMVAR